MKLPAKLPARVVFPAVVAALLCGLSGCHKDSGRSSGLKCGTNCSSYQHSDSLPAQPPPGTVRLAIGGDSRDDHSGVVPWAFQEAQRRNAKAFFFLGDLELTPAEDQLFLPKLRDLGNLLFYPAMGNHEVLTLGFLRRSDPESRERVKAFQKRFLTAPVNLAPLQDVVAYSVDLKGGDLEGNIHLVALDNVSQGSGGFGAAQLSWLEQDLKAASAAKKVIVVGMHKGLAKNPVTSHAMDEDKDKGSAVQDSDAALALFKKYGVALVVVSHSHMYAAYSQDGVAVRLTGGMGAPLVKGLPESEGGFHHFLLVDVPPGENRAPLRVEVVRFQGTAVRDQEDEGKEAE